MTEENLGEAVAAFTKLRPRLFGIAYRVLGSTVEAEDVVQEAWLRWQRTDRSVVVDAASFLSRTTVRLAINVAQSARVRRETYVGPWLPEPVDTGIDPIADAEPTDALELALLLVLQRLTPTERAAYVLREAFDYGYADIAEILGLTPVNARKIVSRARGHLADNQRESVDTREHTRLLEAFIAAAQEGDVASLEALLAPDAVSLSDGNGLRGASRVPVIGRARVAHIASALPRLWPGEVRFVEANGRRAVLLYQEDQPIVFMTIAASKQGVHQVLWVFNPSKIAAFIGSRDRFATAPR